MEEHMNSVKWDDVPRETLQDGVTRQVIWGGHGTLARFSLAKGAHVGRHSHPSEQFTSVISGVMRLAINGRDIILRAGDVLVIPAFAEHEAWMLEDGVVLDFFAPPRADWREGRQAYLQGP